VIGYLNVPGRPSNLTPYDSKLIEAQEGPAFVDEVQVDVEQVLAAGLADDRVAGPDFFEERAGSIHNACRIGVSAGS